MRAVLRNADKGNEFLQNICGALPERALCFLQNGPKKGVSFCMKPLGKGVLCCTKPPGRAAPRKAKKEDENDSKRVVR